MVHVAARSNTRPQRGGFTLVEMLVVIGILAALVAMLLPSLMRARKAGEAIACMSNLRQLGVATAMYENEYGGAFPPNLYYYMPDGVNPMVNNQGELWDIKLAPYLHIPLNPLTATFPNDIPNSPPLRLFQCPSDNRFAYPWGFRLRSYTASRVPTVGALRPSDGVVWHGFPGTTPVKASMVKHSSDTAYLIECWVAGANGLPGSSNVEWCAAFADIDGWLGTAVPYQMGNTAFYHRKMINVLWCDGHVSPEDAYQPYKNGKSWWSRD